MNILVVWAWMLWSSDAVKHERSYGVGMDALVDPRMQSNMTIIWFGHGCSGHRMQSSMHVIVVWAWILWSSDAVEHKDYYGLGMNILWSSDAVEQEH